MRLDHLLFIPLIAFSSHNEVVVGFVLLDGTLYESAHEAPRARIKRKVEKSLALWRTAAVLYVTWRSEYGVREYPIEIRAHAGVYPRISGLTAANSPRYYPYVDPSTVGELM